MKFKNVKVPEGINVSRHSPLADLFLLSAGTFALFGAVILVAYVMGGTLARHMPVAWENALAAAVIGDPGETAEAGGTAIAQDQAGQAAGIELQALADRLSAHMSLPRDLRLTVHYQDDEAVNAFATLGGHIFVNRGLLQHLPSENALAMVMAHEIAHAANRDPAAALGGAALLQLALAVVLGSAPDSVDDLVVGSNALLLLAFSREAETRADRDALAAVAALYGHVADAPWLFEAMLEGLTNGAAAEPPAMLSTHPLSDDRITALAALAQARGWATEGALTPLPSAIAALAAEP